MTPCVLCHYPELEPLFLDLPDREYNVRGLFSFAKCPQCGLVSLEPTPGLKELLGYYPPDYHGYHIAQRGLISSLYRLIYAGRFRLYRELIGTRGRLLDIGCADAPYADLLKRTLPGMEFTGVEFNEEIAERGRARGLNIITGTIDDLKAAEPFDLIIMNNLIEHVTDPVHELSKAESVLKPSGFIILETPNTDSWDFLLFGRYWGSLHVPRHLYLFSPKSIRLLADRSGMVEHRFEFLLSTDNWALSTQNLLQSRSFTKSRIENGRAWYYKYLLLAFVPLCAVQRLFRKTGAFVLILRKR